MVCVVREWRCTQAQLAESGMPRGPFRDDLSRHAGLIITSMPTPDRDAGEWLRWFEKVFLSPRIDDLQRELYNFHGPRQSSALRHTKFATSFAMGDSAEKFVKDLMTGQAWSLSSWDISKHRTPIGLMNLLHSIHNYVARKAEQLSVRPDLEGIIAQTRKMLQSCSIHTAEHSQVAPRLRLKELLEGYTDAVQKRGLKELPLSRLIKLLYDPDLVLALQGLVVTDFGQAPYWSNLLTKSRSNNRV